MSETLDRWEEEAKSLNEGLRAFKHPTDLELLKYRETSRILALIEIVRKKDGKFNQMWSQRMSCKMCRENNDFIAEALKLTETLK